MNIISLGFTMSKMQMLFWYLIFVETWNQLQKVKNSLEHVLIEPSFNLGIIFDENESDYQSKNYFLK